MGLPIYCDIDGTLTDKPLERWGNPRTKVIEKVRRQIAAGVEVVLWSAGGGEYAQAFGEKYDIKAIAFLGKPSIILDDLKTIRTAGLIRWMTPEEFLAAD